MRQFRFKKFISILLCILLLCSMFPKFSIERGYAAGNNMDQSLSWLKKQFDPPVYPSKLELSDEYSYEYTGPVSGKVDISTLPNSSTKKVTYIQTNNKYVQGYSGDVSGIWGNIEDPNKYNIIVYDRTDMNYEIAKVSLNSNGTWTAGELTFHGTPIISLVDQDGKIIAYASDTPISEIINEYEVWIYSVSDIPYLQVKVPISTDGSFSTEKRTNILGLDIETYKGVKEGEKIARIVRTSDEKVFGSTEVPKYKLIRSYNVPIDDPVNTLGIDRRSWIYDDALAIMAFSMAGDRGRASSILSTLSNLQNSDGSLAFSYDVYSGPLDERKRSGSIAWVGDAAIKYEETFGDSTYRSLALRIANYLLSQQDKSTGSIKGGPDVNWYSTEHNIDSYFFFRNLGRLTGNTKYISAANKIQNALLTYHWNHNEKRFNQGINDPADALDTNSWGSIFLEAIGREDLSKTATEYLKRFEVNNVPMNLSSNEDNYNMTYQSNTLISGYKPYGNGYQDAPNIVWSEGTWGVINLFLRQGKNVGSLMNSMFALQNADPEGGLVYTNSGYAPFPYEFHVWPSVAGTAWQYITLKNPRGIWDDNKKDETGLIGDILEENNTIETAKDIGLNSFENLSLHSSSDIDYYKITPYFSERIKIVIPNIKDYELEVITPSGTKKGYSNSGYKVIDLDVNEQQTYYIKVYSPSGLGTVSQPYSLLITDEQDFKHKLLLDNLNKTISSEQISVMQEYLTKMQFYKGVITGTYNSEFFMSVASYQSTLNKWDPRTEINGLFNEDGIMSDRLVVYARDDVNLGRDNEGSIYNTLFLGDAMILSWGAEAGVGIGATALMSTRWGSKIVTRTLQAVTKGDIDSIGGKLLQETLDIRTKLPSSIQSRGNMGIADITIEGNKQKMVAHSQINTIDDINALDPSIREDFVGLNSNRTFIHRAVNNFNEIDGEGAYTRIWDTEGKIMEELALQLGDNWNANGTIDLFTDRNPCPSCSGVMDQFQERYPNITINVFYDKDRFNPWRE